MITLNQNEARKLPVMLIDSTDHLSPKTGIAEGSVTVKISKDLGTLTDFTLTGKWAEKGQGLYSISFSASDLDTVGFFGYLVTVTSCDQYSGMMYVDAPRATEAKQGAIEAALATIKGVGWTNETLKLIKELVDELETGEKPKPKAHFRV